MGLVKKNILLTIFAMIFIITSVKAQLSVNIIPSIIEGCAPQNIAFSCVVSGGECEDLTYNWRSGNGDVSIIERPTFSYLEPGDFTVSLTVNCGDNTASATQNIVIHNSPRAAFNNDSVSGCVPYTYSFTDLSIQGDAPIVSRRWYYGDGFSDFISNSEISHTFSTSGTFTVSLEVTDENGCLSQTYAQMLYLSSPPVVNFSAENNEWCLAPQTVDFTADVQIAPNVPADYDVIWDFGDGFAGSGDVFSHTYSSLGFYDVQVVVTDSYNCQTIVTKDDLVKLGEFVPLFSAQSSVCVDVPTSYESLMENSVQCSWNFGDGSELYNNETVTFAYHTPGIYTGTFTIDPGADCEQSKTFIVEVDDLTASYSTVPTLVFSCEAPFNISFNNTSEGNATEFLYDFGDQTTSNEENPTHIYTDEGRYEVTFVAETESGCYSEFKGPSIIIHSPHALIDIPSNVGCVPQEITFDYIGTYTDETAIVDFHWNYGDGETEHTTTNSISHIYTEIGYFPVCLIITDTSNCTDTVCYQNIEIGDTVYPEFYEVVDVQTLLPVNDTICPNEEVYMYNSLYMMSDTVKFHWIINDSSFISTLEYFPFMFDFDTGWNSVGLRIEYLNCDPNYYFWDSVYVLPPIVKINNYTNCFEPLKYNFNLENRGAEYWTWYFFDVAENDTVFYQEYSTEDSLLLEFPDFGLYKLRFTAYNENSGCSYEDSLSLNIINFFLNWELSADTLCIDAQLQSDVNDNSLISKIAYDWSSDSLLDEGELDWIIMPAQNAQLHLFETGGLHTITLYVMTSDGCVSHYSKQVYVVDPTPTLLPEDPIIACRPYTANFECVSDTPDGLQSITWYFGPDFVLQNGSSVSNIYSDTGTYYVQLRLVTGIGCIYTNTFLNYVSIVDLEPINVNFDDNVCRGDVQTFISQQDNPDLTYFWNFGDGTEISSHESIVTHQYQEAGHYTLSLKLGGLAGCADSVSYPVKVEHVESNFSLAENNFDCYPASIDISANVILSPPDTEVHYEWQMGNGDILNIREPEYLYNTPGIYGINFSITSTGGCHISKSDTVFVLGPTAQIGISDTTVCVGDEIIFTVENPENVETMIWIVGGGNQYTTQIVHHSYNYVPEGGVFPIVLSITNGNCTIDITDSVYVYETIAEMKFVSDDNLEITSGKCSPLSGNIININNSNENLQWYINETPYGDGQNILPLILENNTTQDSTVTISLVQQNIYGCRDSVFRQYQIYHNPLPILNNDTIICFDDQMILSVSGGEKYYWTAPISDSASSHLITPTETTKYKVDVFTDKLCMASDSVTVTVSHPPEIYLDPQTQTINIGDTVVVSLLVDQENLYYSWTPNTNINCPYCSEIFLFPPESMVYTLIVEDSLRCTQNKFNIDITVIGKYTLDVPDAFTPLSEDENSIVYVKGEGIKKLLQFRIYNRWGEEVFSTTDINTGWNGYLRNELQNIDTYTYYVEVEMYNGSIKSKKGNIMLIK